MDTISLHLGPRSYRITIASGSLQRVATEIDARHSRLFVLTDTNVAACGYPQRVVDALTASGREAICLTVVAGEGSKSIDTATDLWNSLLAHRADRASLLITVGGGVVGDLGGFVAATFARGIGFFQVPTTLLAQVDSSVGGKVAINLPQAKNSIGAFHQPRGVVIDTEVLRTLPDDEFSSGVGEVAKYAIALDASLCDFLDQHTGSFLSREATTLEEVIARCCRIKANIIEDDERETGDRRVLLNYGHTFAHAFETLSHYAIAHGHAVAIGMRCAARLAARLGIVADDVVRRSDALLTRLGLPQRLEDVTPVVVAPADVVEVMRRDKKTERDRLRLVVPTAIGACQLVDGVAASDIEAVVAEVADGAS